MRALLEIRPIIELYKPHSQASTPYFSHYRSDGDGGQGMRLPVTSFTISLDPNSNAHLQCYNNEAVDIFDEQPQSGGRFKVLYHILSLTTSRQEDTPPSAEME